MLVGPTAKFRRYRRSIPLQLSTGRTESPATQQAEISILPGVLEFAHCHVESSAHQHPEMMQHFGDGRRATTPRAEDDNDRLGDRHHALLKSRSPERYRMLAPFAGR
jgi:hypothetical protein